jgi:hypothetical protein
MVKIMFAHTGNRRRMLREDRLKILYYATFALWKRYRTESIQSHKVLKSKIIARSILLYAAK